MAIGLAHLKKGVLHRLSYRGVEIRLLVTPGEAWLTIKRPGEERQYRDIPQAEVDSVLQEFQAVEDDVEKFHAFVNAKS